MKWVIVPFVLIACSVFGQEKFESDTVVKGHVYDFKTKKLVSAMISGVGVDGSKFEVQSKDGFFWLSNDLILPDISYVLTVSDPDKSKDRRFLNRTFKLTTVGKKESDLPLKIEQDIDFRTTCRGMIPYVFFGKNSSELDSTSIYSLKGLSETLFENPTLVIEVIGRAGLYESNGIDLAKKRAQNIIDFVEKDGIERKRMLHAVQLADSLPFIMDWYSNLIEKGTTIDNDFVDSISDEKIKEEARKFNSAAQFKVLRNDYGLKNE